MAAGDRLPVTARNTSSRSAVWIDSRSTATWAPCNSSSSSRTESTVPSAGTCRTSWSRSGTAAGSSPAAERRRSGPVKWSRTCPPGIRLFSSVGVPSATIRPWSSTAIRSASWSASSRFWVVSRMVTPAEASWPTISHIVRRLRGSKPVVGSSRKITRGSPTRVMARSSRRRIPPEYVDSGLSAASVRSNCSNNSITRRFPAWRPRWRRSAISCRFSAPVSRLSTAENWPVTPMSARTPSASVATS